MKTNQILLEFKELLAELPNPWVKASSSSTIYKKFDPLASQGIIACHLHDGAKYFYLKDEVECLSRAISFKIPNACTSLARIDQGTIVDVDAKSIVKIAYDYMTFIAGWVINAPSLFPEDWDSETKAHVSAMLYHYSRVEGVLSIPSFLMENLIGDLKLISYNGEFSKFNIQYNVLDKERVAVNCPKCDHDTIVKEGTEFVKCQCGCEFETEESLVRVGT